VPAWYNKAGTVGAIINRNKNNSYGLKRVN
jgi:hypothetical protein